ncbi:hypothetical protein HC248_00045 [Polaromonas vacuolata]|uniref:Chromosome partition protein Smc n=1 Tax=Polaromonas vacuolata TaxID=37448 RepID=A0A6H2H4Q4_9BURK|nr:hypothetical protein HC248_00045 [Polaromonas vacuolata]
MHIPTGDTATQVASLNKILERNTFIEEAVSQSASEMLLINTVLKQEIPKVFQTGDVGQALQQSDALEGKLTQTAQNLAQINQTLSEEVKHRADLEQELAATKAALEQAQSKS